jgi:hypothetical protein
VRYQPVPDRFYRTPTDCRSGTNPRRQGDDIPMRETSPRGWHRWRVKVIKSAPPPVPFDHTFRRSGPPSEPTGPDGIRHELVARVRRQIAEGTYDTEEKWRLAEEALLRRLDDRA